MSSSLPHKTCFKYYDTFLFYFILFIYFFNNNKKKEHTPYKGPQIHQQYYEPTGNGAKKYSNSTFLISYFCLSSPYFYLLSNYSLLLSLCITMTHYASCDSPNFFFLIIPLVYTWKGKKQSWFGRNFENVSESLLWINLKVKFFEVWLFYLEMYGLDYFNFIYIQYICIYYKYCMHMHIYIIYII